MPFGLDRCRPGRANRTRIAPQQSAAGIPNAYVTSDMSKALSLPGLRMGWIIAPDDAQRARIIDARSYFTISSSPLLERLATQPPRVDSSQDCGKWPRV